MKAIGLLSGGIDSPVAIHLMRERGCEIIPVYFDNSPFSGEDTRERVKEVAQKLGFKELLVVPHGETLLAFARSCERRLGCVFCRRIMLRTAERLAGKLGAEALVTGESLGQVASQTSSNIRAEQAAVSIPIIRPLIGMNKEEIVGIARRIGTFGPSTRPAICCRIVPHKPATRATREQIEGEEKKLDVEALISNEVEHAERLTIQ